MKTASDNWRQSAIFNIITGLISDGFKIYLYEPLVKEYVVNNKWHGIEVVDSVQELAEKSSLIIANRMNPKLNPYKDKVYTRDIFNRD
jgi:UDPglucose 6-dehydrogenase